MTELKPCPFCGGEAKLYSGPHYDGWHKSYWAVVKCLSCGTLGMKIDEYEPVSRVEECAAEEWNQRTDECDRGKLVELANDLDDVQRGLVTGKYIEPMEAARRIREALGVEQ